MHADTDQVRKFEPLLCVAPVEILEMFLITMRLQVMLPHLSIAPVIFSVKIPVNNCIPNENAEKEIKTYFSI